AILGTFLMILIFFSQNQVVDADHEVQSSSLSDANQKALTQLKSFLADTASDAARENLENKIQALEYKLNLQDTAKAQSQKSIEQICNNLLEENSTTTNQSQVEKPTGIFPVREDFLVPQGFLIENMWRGKYRGYEVELYGGSVLEEEQKGLVILSIPEINFFEVFYDPEPNGAIKILQIDGLLVTLSSTNGSTLYFDIPAQQFTNEMTKNMAVVDLPLTPTPITDPCVQFTTP
ncbi:MAG: hypothetical protein K0B14_15925, partial [Anaerolineaceae bacterium]|nr:hypothetical protein [Anaerolineaceae bacterium]